MSRPKRPRRLAWFAMDVDAFNDDDRMVCLSIKERAQWLMMLVKAFRNKGIVITDPVIVQEQTGATSKEAKALLGKLYDQKLIIPTEDRYKAASNRMIKEYEIATEAYERFSAQGKASADKHGTANLKLVK